MEDLPVGRIAVLVPEFAVKDLPLGRTLMMIFYYRWITIIKISSTHVQHKVGSRDEMRWSPDIVGEWIARVPADHAWRTITRADEKWNGVDEMSMEKWWNEICGRGKREKPREKPTQTPFRPPRNPHGVTETRTRDASGERRASNRLRHEAAYFWLSNHKLFTWPLLYFLFKENVWKDFYTFLRL